MIQDFFSLIKSAVQATVAQLDRLNQSQAKLHDQILIGIGGFIWLLFVRWCWLSSPLDYFPLLIAICIGMTYAIQKYHRFNPTDGALATPFYSPVVAAVLSFVYTIPNHPAGLAVLSVLLLSYSFIRQIGQSK